MIGWLQLTDAQRKAVIDEAEQLSGITAKAIEKDWWVTLTLKTLFQSEYRQYMVFKGGTSLSKCWNLIARFSEDIDIALDPQAFGMDYLENPSKAYVKRLKRAGCAFTSNELKAEIERQLQAMGLQDGVVTIEAEPIPEQMPDTDPQVLFLRYPSLYEPNGYIIDSVKIEVSVRSMRVPFTTIIIQSLLHSINPKSAYTELPFPVEVVEARKTFLEKIFLLHEEFGRPDKTRIRTERMSRHLYDLFKMMNSEIADAALADHALYKALIQHREWYSNISWVDYASLSHETVSFLPVDSVIEDYHKDYLTMQEAMIYENAALFEEIIFQLKLLQGRIRMKHEHKTLDEVIIKAKASLKTWEKFDKVDGALYSTVVSFLSDPYLPSSPENKSVNYNVQFSYKNNQLIFENINIPVQ
jgi:hypothetical protein